MHAFELTTSSQFPQVDIRRDEGLARHHATAEVTDFGNSRHVPTSTFIIASKYNCSVDVMEEKYVLMRTNDRVTPSFQFQHHISSNSPR